MKETYRVPCFPEMSKFLKLDDLRVRDKLFETIGFSEHEAEKPVRRVQQVKKTAGMENLTSLQIFVYGRQDAA